MFAARMGLPLSPDQPSVTFTGPGGNDPITGTTTPTYAYNTTAIKRLGVYAVTVSTDFQENQINGQTGSNAQPWAIEFDTRAPDIVMRFKANSASARIWCWVDGLPVSEMAPDQTANITSGSQSWYRLRFRDATARRIRLWLTSVSFGGLSVPTGYNVVANPLSEVRRCVWVGDSWGTESGLCKFPYTVPFLVGRAMGWTMANGSIAGSGFLAGTPYSTASRITGRNAAAPHFVILQGSINDNSFNGAAIQAAVSAYLTQLASDIPSCRVFVIGPQCVPTASAPSAALLANRDAVVAAALAASNVYGVLDPIAGRWLRGSGTITTATSSVGDGNASENVAADTLHLTSAGAVFWSQRIVEGILRCLEKNDIWRQSAGANDVVPTALTAP
jgi:hypothetical protein